MFSTMIAESFPFATYAVPDCEMMSSDIYTRYAPKLYIILPSQYLCVDVKRSLSINQFSRLQTRNKEVRL